MQFCVSCGSQINDNDSRCPFCGATQGNQQEYGQSSYAQEQSGYGQSSYAQNQPGYGQSSHGQLNNDQKHAERTKNVQDTLSKLPLSPGFIMSAISGSVLMIVAMGIYILFMAMFYLFSAIAIISANSKLARCRYETR